ncbi:hypothetical protein K503DRAFT_806364 [Rhizopogon vinicolor AM-OR11-026]|uniref:Uncharacterized protein n=1 Tax=Rhizopogon vinicolor AM-OR11-026 TaxID=1314800 RepID=A0A1B7MET3_9AGAM|nr:hypothetical protein K503DRAFT_806364 [Rhizopogon vinicolor AM-OR11-026]
MSSLPLLITFSHSLVCSFFHCLILSFSRFLIFSFSFFKTFLPSTLEPPAPALVISSVIILTQFLR